ncbi:MAG TPA: xanthine dehydrogenase family protein subunit M [Chloroflexota bacterium]|nr:xanthine dehydrogenase family protein subunit M [Chloroflexota bacterium]
MIPAPFGYQVATTVDEAIARLHAARGARILAGGQSLIPVMKTRRVRPSMLVDISRVDGLRGIRVSAEAVSIGPLSTHAELESSPELLEVLPVMREAARVVADPPVRNRGTFGGSLAFADPAGDWPAVALALEARLDVRGPNGDRGIGIDEFFLPDGGTRLGEGEIITSVTIPLAPADRGMAYLKLRHPASGYALVGVAAVVSLDGEGICRDCRIAVTGHGTGAVRARTAEDALIGCRPDSSKAATAGQSAARELSVVGDLYASEEYRSGLIAVHVDRAVRRALERVGGSQR